MRVRDATVNDYEGYARLFPHLGVDDPLPGRERFAAELAGRMVVAADGDAVVGYALYEVLADTGYVRNLVTDPARRRRGVGAALMAALRDRFRARGLARWCLNVKPDNTAAIALYQRCGLSAAYRSAVLRMPADVALAAPPASLRLAPIAPDDDERVEQTFRLLPGQLASARAKAGRLALRLDRDGVLVGVAVLSPAIPGAFPFRVAAPEWGVPLVVLLRGLAPPGAAHLQVGVEDDDALRAALVASGARLVFEMLHMRGALPGA
jgi:ribosomal protein S18 acetylase RimI-like enzyme